MRKKEIKEFTAEQLNLFVNIKKLTSEHNFETIDEVIDYISANCFSFSNKE